MWFVSIKFYLVGHNCLSRNAFPMLHRDWRFLIRRSTAPRQSFMRSNEGGVRLGGQFLLNTNTNTSPHALIMSTSATMSCEMIRYYVFYHPALLYAIAI